MRLTLLACALLTTPALAQWQIQQSNTSASLRGIHSLGHGIAWASGTEGTILRTTDLGQHWQRCTTPPAAEHLDFRGIQAFDAQTAIVMSSGKGDLSRLYKTTDACQTWTLSLHQPRPGRLLGHHPVHLQPPWLPARRPRYQARRAVGARLSRRDL